MVDVHLRPANQDNWRDCLRLQVAASQADWIASNTQSLADAKVNSRRVRLAVYDGAARSREQPDVPVLGCTMYEAIAGVGFILRLMIDQTNQRRGYGRATVVEVMRRLRLHPEVEMIATSHRRDNVAAAHLYGSLGNPLRCGLGWAWSTRSLSPPAQLMVASWADGQVGRCAGRP